MKKILSSWWSLGLHCSWLALLPCLCHIVWFPLYPSGLYLLVVFFWFVFFYGWHSVPSWLVPCTFWDGSDSLANRNFGSLFSWRAGQLMSHSCLSALLWCNQQNLQTQALLWLHSPGHTFSGVHPYGSLVTPEDTAILLGVNKVKVLFEVASYKSLCLLNLRASKDFHWEREKRKTDKEKLTTWTCASLPPSFLSFFLHHWMVLKGGGWSESLQSYTSMFTHDWVLLLVQIWAREVVFLPCRHRSNFEIFKMLWRGLHCSH